MKIRNTITKVVTLTMVVAAMAVIGSTVTAEAQHVRVFDGISLVGVIPGQMLRFSVLNLNAPEPGSRPARAQVLLYDVGGQKRAIYSRAARKWSCRPPVRHFDFNAPRIYPRPANPEQDASRCAPLSWSC